MEVQEVGARALQRSRRESILSLQSAVMSLPQDQQLVAADCPVRHFFAPGSYAREITMPAGIVVVGKIHKHSHVNILTKGHVRVFTEQEGEVELIAPCTFVSSAMTKRVVWVLEETVWTTFHATDKTNPEDVEKDIIAVDYED